MKDSKKLWKLLLCGLLVVSILVGLWAVLILRPSGTGEDPVLDATEGTAMNTPGEIANPSFENGLEGWIVDEASTPDAVYLGSDSRTGNGGLSMWSLSAYQGHAYQVITGLEPGYYYLTCYAQNSGGQNNAYVYANGTQQSRCMTALSVSNELNGDENGWTQVTVRGIQVGEDGIATIGVSTDAIKRNYINLDDFSLNREEDQSKQKNLLLGGDISELSYVESCGAKFYDAEGNEADPLQILADSGWTIARIRYYNNPGKGRGDGSYYCHEDFMNAEDVLSLARRAKEKGMAIQLTFHLSDYWSNGVTQNIPTDWLPLIEGLSEEDAVKVLTQCVYEDVKQLMERMAAQGTTPEYVSIGNEIQSGTLFPYGVNAVDTWPNLAAFFTAGYDAVKEVSPDTQVILHLDACGDKEKYAAFFDNCEKYGAKYDVIGSSYYPFWTDKSVAEAVEFCNWLIGRYDKDIMIMETGYNFNETRPSGYAGQLSDNGCYEDIYDYTPEGQRDFLIELFNGLKTVEGGRVLGDLYWDPVMVEQNGVGWAFVEDGDYADGNVVSNTTLFDFDHKLLCAGDAYAYNVVGSAQGEVYASVIGDGETALKVKNTEITVQAGTEEFQIRTDGSGGGFLRLNEADNLELKITVPGYETVNTQTATIIRGEDAHVVFKVNGGDFSGKVTDEHGNPVTNAEVYIYNEELTFRAYTDGNGAYIFEDIPEGSYTVGAYATGYEMLTEEYEFEVSIGMNKENVDFAADLTSGTITGFMLDSNGSPVPWPSVKAVSGNVTVWGSVNTTDGSFVIPYVPVGNGYQVIGSCWSYDDASARNVSVTEGETTELEAFVLVQQLGSVTGKVVDADGNPLADAAVMVSGTGGSYEAVTDASGTYLVENIIIGNYTTTAQASGKMDGTSALYEVKTNATTSVADIIMPTPITIDNGSFEDYDGDELVPSHWVIDCTDLGKESAACIRQNRDKFGGTTDGTYGLSMWLDRDFYADAYLPVTDLEPGKYVFSAQVYSGINSDYVMYVTDANGNVLAEQLIPLTNAYTPFSLEFECAGGEVHIGFRTDTGGGDWAVIDSVELGIME